MLRLQRSFVLSAVVTAALLTTATSAHALLAGPFYPAPGGNGFGSVGNAGDPGGLTGTYSGFDNSAFATLYWGPQWGTSGPGAGLDGILHALSFVSVSGTTAIWQGTTSYTSPGGPGPASCASCPIRLEVDIAGLGANPWVLEGSVVGLGALAPGIGAVVDNSAGVDFDANFQFLADLGSGFVAVNPIPTFGGTVTSVSGAFYSDVPEPGTALLLGSGLLALARRKRRSA